MPQTSPDPASPTVRKRAAHLGPERRRPLVLDAAFELFLEHGFDGTTMGAIADAAGVTKPVVYDCYPSKDELFKALMRREETRVLEEIGSAVAGAASLGDPEQFLVASFTAFLRAVAASPAAYRVVVLGEGGANASVARRIQRGRERQVEVIAQVARSWLERRGGDGDLDSGSLLVANAMVALGEGGARTMLNDPGRWTPESLGAALGRLAARGVEAV